MHTGTFLDLLVKSVLHTVYLGFEYWAGTEKLYDTIGIAGICYVVNIGTALKGNKLERDQ